MLETKHTFPSSHKEANMSHFCSNKSDSSSRLARSFKNSAWSMSSLMTALPESPSTICSNASTAFHPNTHHATEFSTPRHHVRTTANPSRNSFQWIFLPNNHFLHYPFLPAFLFILSGYFFSGFLKMFPLFSCHWYKVSWFTIMHAVEWFALCHRWTKLLFFFFLGITEPWHGLQHWQWRQQQQQALHLPLRYWWMVGTCQ